MRLRIMAPANQLGESANSMNFRRQYLPPQDNLAPIHGVAVHGATDRFRGRNRHMDLVVTPPMHQFVVWDSNV